MSGDDAAAPSARGEVAIGTIRTALQARIEATSLRGVAREVGITASGLKKVLDGGAPYPKTIQKLHAWHGRHLAGEYNTAQEVALEALLRNLPTSHRARAGEQVLAILRGEDPCV